jgi:integrase
VSGCALAVGTLPAGVDRELFAARLVAAIRPEFAVEVIVPAPGDVVLGTPACAVPDCGRASSQQGWCQAHFRRWDKVGRPERQAWAAAADPQTWGHRRLAGCRAPGCRFSQHRDRLCYRHSQDWRRDGQPEIHAWLAALPPTDHRDHAECAVDGCDLLAELGEPGLCRSHRVRWRSQGRPGLAEFLFCCAIYGEPRFDLRGLTAQARLEIGYVLQCRVDERRARTTPRAIALLLRYLAEQQTVSLLDHSAGFWAAQVTARLGSTSTMRAFIGYAIDCLTDLRDGTGWESEYDADIWRLARLGLPVTRRARFDFRDIDPAWLRELIKRWLRWRISAGLALTQVRKDFAALTRFVRLVGELGPTPAGLDRAALERYLGALAIAVAHPKTRSGDICVIAAFLHTAHQQQWALRLPASAVIHRGDHPRQDTDPPPRALPESVMAQLEDPANLDRLTDARIRLLVEMMIRTGLRVGDACRLRIDCLVRDRQQAPYLHYRNHKMRREAMVPIDEQLAAMIETQQRRVLARYPKASVLFPRSTGNPDGQRSLPTSTFDLQLKQWLIVCHVTDELGEPAQVTAHRFRHTYASRLINSEVSQEVVRRLLDHTSHTMTARYARLADSTIRRAWERAQKIDIRGEPVELPDTDPLGDAAWMKQSLARAKMALPNGYCGLPLQRSCPHANACLTCPLFITTAEFLPEHHQQLVATRELITKADAAGQTRLAEMNRAVETNLLTIIDTLEHANCDDHHGCASECRCRDGQHPDAR